MSYPIRFLRRVNDVIHVKFLEWYVALCNIDGSEGKMMMMVKMHQVLPKGLLLKTELAWGRVLSV